MMHFILQQNHFFYLLCIFITQTVSAPVKSFSLTKQYNGLEEDRTLNEGYLLYSKLVTSSTIVQYSTASTAYFRHHISYHIDLKVIAIFLASLIFGFGIVRLFLMMCKSSRSSNNVLSNRRTSIVRPQIATIERTHFKPDLPPAYAEAVTIIDNDESKLPSYEEVRNTNT